MRVLTSVAFESRAERKSSPRSPIAGSEGGSMNHLTILTLVLAVAGTALNIIGFVERKGIDQIVGTILLVIAAMMAVANQV